MVVVAVILLSVMYCNMESWESRGHLAAIISSKKSPVRDDIGMPPWNHWWPGLVQELHVRSQSKDWSF